MDRLLVVWCPQLLLPQEHGREARAFDRVVEAAGAFTPVVDRVRPGVLSITTRGPSRYFGGDDALADLVHAAVQQPARLDRTDPDTATGDTATGDTATGDTATGDTATGETVGVGIADGLFAAVLAADVASRRGRPVAVPPGATAAFLAPWPVTVLERPELADLLIRLGIRTLGALAALPPDRVLARFGTDGAACRRAAAGEIGELPGCRAAAPPRSAGPAPVVQPGFWGGTAGADGRAAAAVDRVRTILGPETVLVAARQGGRGPAERARFTPWGGADGDRAPGPGPGRAAATTVPPPWPGQLPSPQPIVVPARPRPAALTGAHGDTVGVTGRGLVTVEPARLSVDGGAWADLAGWAGPWLADERWWSSRGRRRRARMQVVTAEGRGYLLVREQRGWWVEGSYD